MRTPRLLVAASIPVAACVLAGCGGFGDISTMPATLAGRVVGPEGEGLSGVEVSAQIVPGKAAAGRAAGEDITLSDSTGEWEITNVQAGRFRITMRKLSADARQIETTTFDESNIETRAGARTALPPVVLDALPEPIPVGGTTTNQPPAVSSPTVTSPENLTLRVSGSVSVQVAVADPDIAAADLRVRAMLRNQSDNSLVTRKVATLSWTDGGNYVGTIPGLGNASPTEELTARVVVVASDLAVGGSGRTVAVQGEQTVTITPLGSPPSTEDSGL
ncbi:MAG: carboxypeptidase regulatory-like domain-containing protein [Armatimonadetes bacterium]|nr:carboxypeptidase regulatory-like domain-containing protein [Armatimonadota bacterium]NCO89991.1 carboxypeptidase regulatory-like domain-containing protein [Armatimonadota bacterium]NCP34259.1 carboxypeptidase regulatory-like domain-containing protein [Armatimonadota bacterium]NDK13959.1 carboxypeptidase regulatory-like domain-containing protein [Armatimonadota bacterium]